jgi:hypothetical protein
VDDQCRGHRAGGDQKYRYESDPKTKAHAVIVGETGPRC